jgi:hypothetical protein
MVAYSFRPRFVDPILSGRKRQTIRAHRKRHARPGEDLQLYQGMRTRHCRLIGKATCTGTVNVAIVLASDGADWIHLSDGRHVDGDRLNEFAQGDGFEDWRAMREFWKVEHPEIADFLKTPGGALFEGVIITWGDLTERGAYA